jgi:hypothetical protein
MAGERADGRADERKGPIDAAEDWIDDHTQPEGGGPKYLEAEGDEPTVAELREEQRREAASMHLYNHTEAQARGGVVGSIVFGAIGLVVGIVIGLVFFDGDSPARFVVPACIAVFAGWVGVVYWGGRTPELENETMTIYGEPEDGTTLRDPGSDERGR